MRDDVGRNEKLALRHKGAEQCERKTNEEKWTNKKIEYMYIAYSSILWDMQLTHGISLKVFQQKISTKSTDFPLFQAYIHNHGVFNWKDS